MSRPDRPEDAGSRAWVHKADSDFLCIENNLAAAHVPWDAVAFHALQGVEKLPRHSSSLGD